MTDIVTRKTVLAVTFETNEGVPVAPTVGADFVELQDDDDMTPDFERLERTVKRNSIGPAKPVLGNENPVFNFSHELKHSGVEGQEPEIGRILEAAFGSKTVVSTERDTVADSTTSLIKVDTGEGVEFPRGRPLLIKDGVNGYSLNMVKSRTGDDLTPLFNLANAPAAAVNLGKPVYYTPADVGHKSMSLFRYLGNEGALEVMRGVRPTELNLDIEAGQIINMSMSFGGNGYYFNPIFITSSTRFLDFTDDDDTFAASVPIGWYKDPHELAAALEASMNALTSETHSVRYSDSTGKFIIATSTSTVLSLLWNTGTNAANTIGAVLGFLVSGNSTGATTYTAANEKSWASPVSPTFDGADPVVAKNNFVYLGGPADNVCFQADQLSFRLGLTKRDKLSVCAESGKSGSLISQREAEITIRTFLQKHDASKFKRFRTNEETSFMYGFGPKVGGNWVPGKCGVIGVPTMTLSSYKVTDNDGLYSLELSGSTFVNEAGEGEVYLGFC